MDPADQETVAIKPCCACGIGLLEESNFCRLCGERQLSSPGSSAADARAGAGNGQHASLERYETSKLSHPILYHPVSGPLVKAVAEGVPACASHSVPRELPKRVLFALMAIPIWVMIILLSPIDAYASAKIIGQRI
jgi:hypothetical protein